jgi:hypothetical protein
VNQWLIGSAAREELLALPSNDSVGPSLLLLFTRPETPTRRKTNVKPASTYVDNYQVVNIS